MAGLLNKINSLFVEAKKQNSNAVRILSVLKSELEVLFIENGRKPLTDQQILKVIKKFVKRIEEAIELYKRAGRSDLVQKEGEDLQVLMQFLPQQLSPEQIKSIILKIKKNKDFRTIKQYIDYMNQYYPGQFDTRELVRLIKEYGDL